MLETVSCQIGTKRLAHEGAHSGRRNFKPKIPSESKDNYLRAFSGNSSARTGQATGENNNLESDYEPTFEEKLVEKEEENALDA